MFSVEYIAAAKRRVGRFAAIGIWGSRADDIGTAAELLLFYCSSGGR